MNAILLLVLLFLPLFAICKCVAEKLGIKTTHVFVTVVFWMGGFALFLTEFLGFQEFGLGVEGLGIAFVVPFVLIWGAKAIVATLKWSVKTILR